MALFISQALSMNIMQNMMFISLKKATNCFVLMSLVCFLLLPQYTIAANQDLNKNKVLSLSIASSMLFGSYRSGALSSIQKADYFLQLKQQELALVQKAEKEKAALLSAKTKALALSQKKATTQKVLIGNEPINVIVTAYSSTPDQTDSSPFVTASNKRVRDGVVAANFLPFGTVVRFPNLFGEKEFIVEDRMKSNTKVDIWFADRQSALRFGIKRTDMVIVSRP